MPDDPTQQGVDLLQPPYYLSLAMPDQEAPAFSLTSTYMPVGDRNVLTGFLAVDGDAGNTTGKKSAAYGTMRLLETTGGTVNGPGQVYNDMRSSAVSSKDPELPTTLAQYIGTTSNNGNVVIFGNQLTLPVGGGLLYVQPIYSQARSASGTYPRLVAVAVAFGNKIAWAGSLDGALNDLFGGSSGAWPVTRARTRRDADPRLHGNADHHADTDALGHRDGHAEPHRHSGRCGARAGAQGRRGSVCRG